MSPPGIAAVFAVDGGNSKAEALLIGRDGGIRAAVRSATVSHQQVGLDGTRAGIVALATRAAGLAGSPRSSPSAPVAELGSYCLAGADFPAEVRLLRRSIEGLGLTASVAIRNDTLAALRAGATRSWGVALICGQGVNGVGVGRDGRVARFDALGDISGDWGGGTSVGWAGLAAAVRAGDGRGPRTVLRQQVAKHYGVRSIGAVVRGMYTGRLAEGHIGELSPLVFAAAAEGDDVAAGIVDHLAEELAVMAIALLRRTGLTRLDPELVLAGGVLQSGHAPLVEGLVRRVRAVVPDVQARVLDAPPVLGAALLGLAEVGLDPADLATAEARLRAEIGSASFTTVASRAGPGSGR